MLFLCACAEPPPPTVTLWHSYSGAEREALEELIASYPGPRVRLVAVPYDALPDKVTSAIPNGNGPDLFIFAHDRIGDWAEARIIAPVELWVDDARADRYDEAPLEAMAYRGSLYGLPLAVKSLALFRRTDLVPSAPATTDELIALARPLTGGGRFGLAFETGKLYSHAPWLFGHGGGLFDAQGALRIRSPEAVAALVFARDLAAIAPSEATGALVGTLFAEGRAAMAVSGPWFTSSLPAGVPWSVSPLPVVSSTGKPAAPFLGAEGLLMSARARDPGAAFAVMDWLASDASAVLRAVRARQVVPNRAAYDDPRLGGDATLAAFRAQAERARPMPSLPAMRMVWTPYDKAIQKVTGQGGDPDTALGEAEREIRGYMEGTR